MDAASSARRDDANVAVVTAGTSSVATAAPQQDGAGTQVLRYCDFRDFVQHLGIDPLVDASGLVMVAAHQMFSAPLPPQWSEHIDEASSRVYFFDALTGESLWIHPQETIFREIVDEVRSWRPDESVEKVFEKSTAHLQQAYGRAIEVISQWSGPYDAPQGPEDAPEFSEGNAQFYFNASTGESRWSDPRAPVEHDLRQRHSIICECMAAHTQNLAKMSPISGDSPLDDDSERRPASAQAFVQNLWASLGSLPLPSRAVDPGADPQLPSDATPPSVRRPGYLPEGNDTVRSSMTYLTARSTTSCTEEARAGDTDALDHPFVLRPAPD
mmetsp:Transcript_13306/g.35684  ORF Transcript_13306/g.35684 Transcript_13306/m.35684 type:complete len:327 (-) Transcript_13306:128-1108(-)